MEFALVLPILCLLLFGIVQFGMLFYTYIDLTTATRDGARKVAVARANGDGLATARQVIEDATTVVDDDDITVSADQPEPWDTAGTDVRVTVTYPYKLNIMGVVVWGGPLRADSIARVE